MKPSLGPVYLISALLQQIPFVYLCSSEILVWHTSWTSCDTAAFYVKISWWHSIYLWCLVLFLRKIRKFKMAIILENFLKSGYSIILAYLEGWNFQWNHSIFSQSSYFSLSCIAIITETNSIQATDLTIAHARFGKDKWNIFT